MARKRAAVIGATGVAGQQFIAALASHPWFELAVLAASARSAGKAYGDAITGADGALRWYCREPLDSRSAALPVQDASEIDPTVVDVVFSAVESDAATRLEPLYAKTTPVVSTASAFRYDEDVPIFIPGVNLHHDGLIAVQRAHRGAFAALGLPSCPPALIDVSDDPFRPQPRLDRDRGDGMVTSVGRVRPDEALRNGIKYVLVSHNTRMGAGKGAILVAEYLVHAGYV